MRIGLISDTHGLLRPQALQALEGSDHILHTGDIGSPDILQALQRIAPVTVVRGNNDTQPWADSIAPTEVLQLGAVRVYALHNLKTLAIDPVAAGCQVVVFGHSHKPSIEQRAGVLYVNPGSAGPRRFRLPVTVAELRIDGAQVRAQILSLEAGAGAPAASVLARPAA